MLRVTSKRIPDCYILKPILFLALLYISLLKFPFESNHSKLLRRIYQRLKDDW